jgi:hypothetical protein
LPDAASGLFASGVAATIAVFWRRRVVVVVAMSVFLAFALPHAVYHAANPADAMSGREDVVNAVTLWVAVAIAVSIFLAALVPVRRDHDERARDSRVDCLGDEVDRRSV